jgi:hypothetical protein
VIVKAWNDGKHLPTGGGYGLQITKEDRDRWFRPEWKTVSLIIEGQTEPVQVKLSPSFWNKCHELRHKAIGKWLIQNGYAPWPKGKRPAFNLIPTSEKTFILRCEFKNTLS